MREAGLKRILVAMSGGVDSSVAVRLLQEQGYYAAGATMVMLENDEDRVARTKSIAGQLGIEFFVFHVEDMFKKQVIEYFADAYIEGRTPNPCIKCNQLFKFGYFLDKALELGFDGIATGHYARIRTEADGKYHLRASGNINKDQSYFLYGMNQIQLSHTVFPLENAEKNQVRAEAERIGLLNAQQKDSQDICFVKSGCYTAVVDGICAERGTARRHGNFVDVDGNVLGTHSGIERYTIGQRKGVGVSLGVGTPLYVIDKRPETAEVVMGADKLLFRQEMTVKNISFVYLTDDEAAAKPMRLTVKTRYNQKPVHVCVEYNAAEKRAGVVFDAPVRAITPGQTAVFYNDDDIIGGGEIEPF